MDYAAEIAKMALELEAIKFSPEKPFTWVSGYRMPIYVNLRLFFSDPKARKLVAEAFADLIKQNELKFDVLAGTATSGIPHATTLSDLLQMPMVYVRTKRKDHGLEKLVEGLDDAELKNKKVIVIEDLISTGGSSAGIVETLRNEKAVVEYCIAIFSYGFPQSKSLFESMNPKCTLLSVLDFRTLIVMATEKGYLDASQKKLMEDWSSDPFNWGARHGFPKTGK